MTLTCHDIWHLLRSHKIYGYLTRSTEISQDLLTFDIWTFTFDIWRWLDIWHLTFDIWHLLRSHKIYWDLARSTETSQDLLRSHKIIWHFTFGNWHAIPWHLTLIWHGIWHLTFDIWHLTWLKVLTALALILIILAQSYLICTDGFWGYLKPKKIISDQTI